MAQRAGRQSVAAPRVKMRVKCSQIRSKEKNSWKEFYQVTPGRYKRGLPARPLPDHTHKVTKEKEIEVAGTAYLRRHSSPSIGSIPRVSVDIPREPMLE